MAVIRGDILTKALASREVTTIENDDARVWLNTLEEQLTQLYRRWDPLRSTTTTTFTVNSTSNTGTKPTDLKTIEDDRLGFYLLDDNSEREMKLPETEQDSYTLGYFFRGSLVVFTGLGDANRTIELEYVSSYTPKTTWNTDDTFDIPDQYFMLPVHYVRAMHFDDLKEFDNEISERGKFDELMFELEQNYNPDPRPISFNSNNHSIY